MVLQQVSETSQGVKLDIWLDRSILLSDGRLYLCVYQRNNILDEGSEVRITHSHRETAQRNEPLASVLALRLRDVVFNLLDDLFELAFLLVIVRDESVHGGDQVNALLFYKHRL